MWPKSSDSSSPSGIAPQFTATKGASARGLARWIARASSSLPVPLAPKMHTLASEAATRRACDSRSSMAEERVMSSARQSSSVPGGRRAREPHRLGHRVEQHLGLEGLGQERKDAAARRRHRLGDRAVRGQDHHRQRGRVAVDGVEQRHAVHALHAQVGDHHLRARHRQGRQRRLARLHRGHRVARGRKPHRDQLQQVLVVVDQQDRSAFACHQAHFGLRRSFSSRSRMPRSIARSASSCCLSASSRLSRSLSGASRASSERSRSRASRRASALELAHEPLALGDLRRRAAPRSGRSRARGVGDRLEQLGGARIVAQRRRAAWRAAWRAAAGRPGSSTPRLAAPARARRPAPAAGARAAATASATMASTGLDQGLHRGAPGERARPRRTRTCFMPPCGGAARRGNARRAPRRGR